MQPVIEQATHALQLGRFEVAKTLISTALETMEAPETRQALFEMLAQAQTGLQDHAAATRSWHEAYLCTTTPDERTRIFESARQAMRDHEEHEALLRLAQSHLEHTRTPPERAACLLAAGEALIHLQRYAEARKDYLEPAMALSGIPPETRLHLWHYLGLSHLAEHTFLEAAAAFRQSADLALGQHFASAGTQQASQRAQLHHLRNAARFYEGIIHLIYQHPQPAIQSFQELQRPLTAVGALNVALFLGLAHRILAQPETATRALQTLARTATSPETLHGPAAIVRAGIATLHESPMVVGEHLDAALEATLEPRTSWEPSWRALFYRELGLAFHHLGCREAALTCYEDALHVIVQRAGTAPADQLAPDLRGAALLTALANLPCHTWSAVLQGELLMLLQTLAWLSRPLAERNLSHQALDLAARLATTPEQEGALWCQRGWLQATGLLTPASVTETTATPTTLLEALQQAQTRCQDTPLAPVLRGVHALLQGDTAQAVEAFTELAAVPEMPEVQTLCVAAWLWAHAQQDTLAQALHQPSGATAPVWHTPTMLASTLEMLLAWTLQQQPVNPTMPWLTALLVQQPGPAMEALRLLCRPGYLPVSHHTALLTFLTALDEQPAYTAVADQLAVLLGGATLVTRVETLLTAIDQQLTAPVTPQIQGGRQRRQRQRREATPADLVATEIAQVLQLITLVQSTAQATGESDLPERICGWLLRYHQLCTHTPEVVGALLGLLRQGPGAASVIPTILEQVPLSRRQRQALETAQQSTPEAVAPAQAWLTWDDMPQWPLGRLFETLSDVHRPTGTHTDTALETRVLYIIAMIFMRVGLPHRAIASLQHCLHLQPQQPLVHYKLAQLLSLEQQTDTAFTHLLQAWHSLQPIALHMPALALAILNQLLTFLATTHQFEQFPAWIATFIQQQQALQGHTLSPTQQQRVAAEEGQFAFIRARYLAATPATAAEQPDLISQQLACLTQAITLGTPPIRQAALLQQAILQTRLYRYEAALETYATLLQQWPEDHRALQRRDVLLALQQPGRDLDATEGLLTAAFTAACASLTPPPQPVPQTPAAALAWLQHTSLHEPPAADLVDILTAYGALALQRQELEQALALLVPLEALTHQPQQAYYLAAAYDLRSAQAPSDPEALRACEQALQALQPMLAYAPVAPQATALLHQVEAKHLTLVTVRQQEQARALYRRQICGLFSQNGVRFQDDVVDQRPEAPWVEVVDVADLDEASGKLITTMYLHFNGQATGVSPTPNEADITLYAQHQRDKQRLVEAHGMEALAWPHTVYEGHTDFALLFPERLGLNRDLIFVAFADPHALIRYARVLHTIVQGLPQSQAGLTPPDNAALAAAARYLVLLPILRQRLQTLSTTAPSKAVQRQMSELGDTLAMAPGPEQLQHCPAFLDAYTYFHGIVEAMRASLDAPPTERPSAQPEERQPQQRPTRRKRRQSKERWREGDGERRREEYFSDVL